MLYQKIVSFFASRQAEPIQEKDPQVVALWTNQNPAYSKYPIGDWTYGRPSVMDWNQGTTLTIGKYCSIADGVTILLGGEHKTDCLTTYPFQELHAVPNCNEVGLSKGDVTIGNDVWIGFGATILSGVTIGDGAIIGAKAVVAKDVDPYAIVAGNPSIKIRYRLSEARINKLLLLKWWEWEHERVMKIAPLLLSRDQEDVERLFDSHWLG